MASYTYSEPGSKPSTTALAPTTGRDAITLGARYTQDQLTVTGGLTYGELGDQTVTNPFVSGGIVEFEDSEVLAFGIRLGYRM